MGRDDGGEGLDAFRRLTAAADFRRQRADAAVRGENRRHDRALRAARAREDDLERVGAIGGGRRVVA